MEVQSRKLFDFPKDFPEVATGVLVPDEESLVTGHTNGFVTRWDPKNGSPTILHDCSSPVQTISISPEKEVVVGCHSGLLFVFKLADPAARTVLQDHSYDVHSRVWRTVWAGKDALISTSTYGVVNAYTRDSAGQWSTVPISGHSHSVFAVDSLNSRLLATGDYQGNLHIWERHERDFALLQKLGIQRQIEGVTWHKDGAFATIDSSGGISFFEQENGNAEWRHIFQTDTATGRGRSVTITDDGRTLFAGTDNEVIQLDLGSQQMSVIAIPEVRRLFSKGNLVFVLARTGVIEFEKQEIGVPIDVVTYRFVKVNILGHTGVGKTTLCNRIVTGSFAESHSTFGKRIWNWNVDAGPPAKRVILFDHGGQEAVLETFLPFLSDSDIFLIFFKQKDASTYERAEEVLEKIRPIVSLGAKVFLVQTHIDDPMTDVDETRIQKLVQSGKIVDRLRVSSTTGEGTVELKARLLSEICWDKARTMIESKDVEYLTKTILSLQQRNASLVHVGEVRHVYESISGSRVSTHHLKFLLSNFSSQGMIEYYPGILDAVILNDREYNTLRTRIPILVKQHNGIVSMKDVESQFRDTKDFVRILDEVYTSSGIAIKNRDVRIFPMWLESDAIEIPTPYKGFLKTPHCVEERSFACPRIDVSRLIQALSELNLSCVKVSQSDGLFSWDNNACVYYSAKQSGDAVLGSLVRLSMYVGGQSKTTCERLCRDFVSIAEKLFGPSVDQAVTPKKKVVKERKFDVALSYAGEQREYVEKTAEILQIRGLKVFYDKFEQSHLWGKDLGEYLHQVYYQQSDWCIMFISEDYVSKMWPSWERKAAMAKQVKLTDQEYILPVRFDDTEIPGLNPSLGYVKAKEYPPDRLTELFLKKFEEGR